MEKKSAVKDERLNAAIRDLTKIAFRVDAPLLQKCIRKTNGIEVDWQSDNPTAQPYPNFPVFSLFVIELAERGILAPTEFFTKLEALRYAYRTA